MKSKPYFETSKKEKKLSPIRVGDRYILNTTDRKAIPFKLASRGTDAGGSQCYVFIGAGGLSLICTIGQRNRFLLIDGYAVKELTPDVTLCRDLVTPTPVIISAIDGGFAAYHEELVAKRTYVKVGDVLETNRHRFTVFCVMDNGTIICLNSKDETIVIDKRDVAMIKAIIGDLKWEDVK